MIETIPEVVIVILNFKGYKDTIECLESVLKLDYKHYKIVVVDNSPDMYDFEQLRSWAQNGSVEISTSFPDLVFPCVEKPLRFTCLNEGDNSLNVDSKVFFIKARNNKGFGAGNNIGLKFSIEHLSPKYMWLLNNDTVVNKDSLTQLIRSIQLNANKNAGLMGTLLLSYYQRDKIQALGGYFNRVFGFTKHIGENINVSEINNHKFSKPDYIVGASMLVDIRFIMEVGLLEEDYFLFNEELDWIRRGNINGWTFDHCYSSIVYHKEGASIGSGNSKRRNEFSQLMSVYSRLMFTKKHYPIYLISVYVGFILICLNRIRKGKVSLAFKILYTIFFPKQFYLKHIVPRVEGNNEKL